MLTREIDLTALFTFVTSGLMAAYSLALCDTEPTPLYFSQKCSVAQRALVNKNNNNNKNDDFYSAVIWRKAITRAYARR